MNNAVYKAKGDYEYTERPATKEELKEARQEAKELLNKNPDALGLRSCWVCNSAHTHFLKGEWGNWILRCFADCGRVYFNKIDITEGEES